MLTDASLHLSLQLLLLHVFQHWIISKKYLQQIIPNPQQSAPRSGEWRKKAIGEGSQEEHMGAGGAKQE